MSKITDIFYSFFWSNNACRNLFLLSKEELLDTKRITITNQPISVSYPRIILSNALEDYFDKDKIQLRSDMQNMQAEATIQNQIEKYIPLFTNYVNGHFGKALDKITKDLEENPMELFSKIVPLLFNEEEKSIEESVIKLLQNYGFIGPHLKSFSEVLSFFQKETIDKNIKSIVNEDTLWNLHEFLRAIKDIYTNSNFQDLCNSNQILTSALYSEDNFKSRIHLFDLLFDAGIISSSREESFVECNNCEPGHFKGVLQMHIRPKNLNKLLCPTCNTALTYYVPYELHSDIYGIVKARDGLILDALRVILVENGLRFTLNLIDKHLNTEFDCVFKHQGFTYMVEAKMYAIADGDRRKLSNKITEHYYKFSEKIATALPSDSTDNIIPILLINIQDREFLEEVRLKCKSAMEPRVEIMNIDMAREYIANLKIEKDIH